MRRRYREYRHRRRSSDYRPRSALTRPIVQIGILLVVALVIFIILQSGGR